MDESLLAVVPIKPLREGKQRLAHVLDDEARMELSRALLIRTLKVLTSARRVSRVVTVSRDREILRLARRERAWGMLETHRGLNEALEQATRVALANGVRALLIVPADLPGLTTKDIERISE